MIKSKAILSTKNLSELQNSILQKTGFDLISANFIAVNSINFDLKNINQNLIFTSQNAAKSILTHPKLETLKSKKVFCVGLKTKALLNDNGFEVEAYTNYAEDLAEIITLVYNDESFTFFSGNLRKDTLPKALKNAKIKFNEIEVYETILTPQKITKAVDAILFFSPSGVLSYLEKNKLNNQICFCIGTTTAHELKKRKIKNIEVAEFPTIDAVIDMVVDYFCD